MRLLLIAWYLLSHSGYLSAYGQMPTDATITYRQKNGQIPGDISQYDTLIAVLDCSKIGHNAILHVGDLRLKALVFDCAGQDDGGVQWMIDNNYIAEVDYYTWQNHPDIIGQWASLQWLSFSTCLNRHLCT